MAGKQTLFFCAECGHESAKWVGQCPACRQWNTMTEAPVIKSDPRGKTHVVRPAALKENRPVSFSEIKTDEEERFKTGYAEMDRVLGGGAVRGSLVLTGGDPGIGKSTLILQMCRNMAIEGRNILYVSGEESLRQIRLRADRIGDMPDCLKLLCDTGLDDICDTARQLKPQLMIVDSIQTMSCAASDSAPGSPAQVRESTMLLMRLAKEEGIAVFIIGHVTKEGVVAGPRMLEHMVDTVLYLEGEKNAAYRILRCVKNRFGATDEIGVFEMTSEGMVEVVNPSAHMISGRVKESPGSVISCLIEGTRPIMVEVQALTMRSDFGIPRRTASGTDHNRVNILMAVMEKHSGVHMAGYDAYVNIAGGIRVTEPALDLAIVMALAGSYKSKELPEDTVCFGEVGLSGEVRAVTRVKDRIAEAAKLKFKTCIVPKVSLDKEDPGKYDIEVLGVSDIRQAIDYL